MPLYAYRAVNARGRVLRGRLEAPGPADLSRVLRGVGLHPVSVRPVGPSARRRRFGRTTRRPADREIATVCLHLERALGAGVSILDALADAHDVTGHGGLARILEMVRHDVAQGQALSEALGRHEAMVGPVLAPMVRAGEESGHLAQTFAHLGHHLLWRDGLRRRLAAALRYPLLVLVTLGGLLIFVTGSVIPALSTFLLTLGEGPPPQTVALLALSRGVAEHGPWLAPLLGGAGALLLLARRRSEAVAYHVDALVLRVPGLGGVLHRLAVARFAHVVALLFRAGGPLPQCLATGRAVLGNRCLAEAVEIAAAAVAAGYPLSEALRLCGPFPPLVWRMVRVGETGGDLAAALDHVGAFHDQDATDAAARLVALCEPLLLGVAGLLLAWIVWAVLLPVYDAVLVMSA